MNEDTTRLLKAFATFKLKTKRSKGDTLRAIGFDKTDINASKLEAPKSGRRDTAGSIKQRLVYSLRRDALPSIAVALKLDAQGFDALFDLAREVERAVINLDVPLESLTVREAREHGEIGVKLLDMEQWKPAVEHLEISWPVLIDKGCLAPENHAFTQAIRVGTQLMSWYDKTDRSRGSCKIANTITAACDRYRGSSLDVLSSICLFKIGKAMSYRLYGLGSRKGVIRICEEALELSERIPGHATDTIAAYRNQAKAYVQLGLEGQRPDPPDKANFDHALSVLDSARLIAGGKRPKEGLEAQWLVNELTRVECLASMRMVNDAERTLSDVEDQDWAQSLTGPAGETWCHMKLTFARLAVATHKRTLDDVASLAQSAIEDDLIAEFKERAKRLGEIRDAACQGDIARTRLLFVK